MGWYIFNWLGGLTLCSVFMNNNTSQTICIWSNLLQTLHASLSMLKLSI